MKTVDLVINPLSGSVTGDEPERLEAIIRNAGYGLAGKHMLDEASIASLKDRPFRGDAIIALAGDGTLKTLLDHARRPVCPLPGGTMNMLPLAVLGAGDAEDLLRKVLAHPVVKPLPAGNLSGHRFYVAAILGPAAHWSKAREAVRRGLILGSMTKMRRALSLVGRGRIAYTSSEPGWPAGEWGHAVEMILMTDVGSRGEVRPEEIECIALFDHSLRALMKLGLATLLAEWRGDGDYAAFQAKTLRLRGVKAIPAILDGEFVRLPKEIDVTVEERAAEVLAFAT